MIYFKDKIIIENEANIYLENKMFAYQNIIEKGKSRKIRFPSNGGKCVIFPEKNVGEMLKSTKISNIS